MAKRVKIWIAILLLILSISLVLNIVFVYQNLERNRVVKVVDGDSFETKDKRRIRLLGIDAPEKGRCLAEKAQSRLKELIFNKRVRLTDIVTDDYGRILANVFVNELLVSSALLPNHLFVNKILLEEGLARFVYVSSLYYEELKSVANNAKLEKKGIYSDLCRSKQPRNECTIKGNTNSSGEKIYHLPACLHYQEVIVDEAYGDQWFCSEDEASTSGFRKTEGC